MCVCVYENVYVLEGEMKEKISTHSSMRTVCTYIYICVCVCKIATRGGHACVDDSVYN